MKNKVLKNVLILLILFLAISAVIMPKELNNLDEVWNYNFARNVAEGRLPYKDFNMVQMPLFAVICGTILKITCNELIVMRFLAVCLMTAILFVTYKILEALKISRYIINISIIGIYLLISKIFSIDYNFMILLIILITLYCEIRTLAKKKQILTLGKSDFWLGILVGSSILLKQTTGIFLSLIFIFCKLLLASKKEDFKTVFKIIGMRLLGVLVPVILLVIYLSVNNIWNEFLDYTVYSLKTFTNKISYLNLINGNYGIVIGILSILIPVTITSMFIISICREMKTEELKNIFPLFCYSVASFIVVYPISDHIHFLIGGFPAIIALVYIFWLIIKSVIKNEKIIYGMKCFINSFSAISIVAISVWSIFTTARYIKSCGQYNQLKHFKYIPASHEGIHNVDSFILEKNEEGKEVYILDGTAALYMIPIDKYNKDYDMFLKGNIGSKGEDGQIEKLKDLDNTVILILNENYRRNWQNPEKVRKYIIENWEKVGQAGAFDIYTK